ncbi:MAG: ABC transporter permease subunit [Candidatus Sericytochromatia bacterium]|nr:ABC transporter permease subunit [Candidatus Sericytochromatia bacterium]
MSAVFLRGLKDRWLVLLALALGLSFFLGMMAWWFPEYRNQAEISMKLLPSFVKKMMGARASMARPEGYVSWMLIHPLTLGMLATWAIGVPAAVLAGTIEKGTLAFTLSGPITRTRYFLAQTGLLITGQAITIAACFSTVAAIFVAQGTLPAGGLTGWLLAGLQALLLMLCIGSLTMLLSARASEASHAMMPAIAFMMVALFVSLFGDVFKALEPIKPLSPFSWFRPYEPLAGKTTDMSAWLALIGWPTVALTWSWRLFRKRNLSL